MKNWRNARDPPMYFACDEQLVPYTGNRSGAKKRMPKKTREGLEYFTIACSNKDYEGYQGEVRERPTEENILGKITKRADPVSGGYKLNYVFSGGRKYEVGTTHPSKTFGIMLMLIFGCCGYFRDSGSTLVTDSAYGFLDGMIFLSLWQIKWLTSLRLAQRQGFFGLMEIMEAGKQAQQGKKKRNLKR